MTPSILKYVRDFISKSKKRAVEEGKPEPSDDDLIGQLIPLNTPFDFAFRWMFRNDCTFIFSPRRGHHGGYLKLKWNGPEGCELEVSTLDVTEDNLLRKYVELIQMAMDKDMRFWTKLQPEDPKHDQDLMDAFATHVELKLQPDQPQQPGDTTAHLSGIFKHEDHQ